jgi:hypothetical protein
MEKNSIQILRVAAGILNKQSQSADCVPPGWGLGVEFTSPRNRMSTCMKCYVG